MALISTTDYGKTISCLLGVDPYGTVIEGPRVVLEAVVRRWTTPRGRLGYDPNYGTDVTQWLNDDVDARGLARMKSALIGEAMKDERVLKCELTITPPPDSPKKGNLVIPGDGKYLFEATIYTADGPFALVLSASGVTVTVLQIEG